MVLWVINRHLSGVSGATWRKQNRCRPRLNSFGRRRFSFFQVTPDTPDRRPFVTYRKKCPYVSYSHNQVGAIEVDSGRRHVYTTSRSFEARKTLSRRYAFRFEL